MTAICSVLGCDHPASQAKDLCYSCSEEYANEIYSAVLEHTGSIGKATDAAYRAFRGE